ncbi:MFS transporter [Geomonas sp. Red32]|uniref:MFS transporter n=1 Tax=Geomonas sp. Red32 TaxID=2912856 RepID=UPI00202CE00B|nr:MFS transporter [Geomonas sp. Red32]MCM0080887.1 MFS transporter [Geomonas sp. Red32]
MTLAAFAIGVVVAPILGPTLGGWLTDHYTWRWAFYINIPVGVLTVFMTNQFVEDPPYIRSARPGRIDAVLMRNVGGSVGISMVTALLARQSQIHQSDLISRLNLGGASTGRGGSCCSRG